MEKINLSYISLDDKHIEEYGVNASLTVILSTLNSIDKNFKKYSNDINHYIEKISEEINNLDDNEDIIDISNII
jgi:hypothetical protein